MAIMWPKSLTPEVTNNLLRQTECDVYRQLKTCLDDSFTVYYSRPWLGLEPDGEEIDGECDFVVAHSQLGILTLEVKGGAIAYDPRTDRWTSRDRWKITHTIKNPVQQARSSKYQILKKLNESPHWKRRFIRARHGVILPHSSTPMSDLGADMPRRIFCFSEQFGRNLERWVLDRFGDAPGDEKRINPLGQDGLFALEKNLASPIQLQMPMATLLSNDDHKLQLLTQKQFYILRMLENLPRAAIKGAAGTGKTILAMEEAVRCAKDGRRTLFLCYNRGLAAEVLFRLGKDSHVEIRTFHQLCRAMIERAGLTVPERVSRDLLYKEIYPEILLQALDQRPNDRFDAIIVDEGQDFHPLWWVAIEACLRSSRENVFRIFYDDNQLVYGHVLNLPKEVSLIPVPLSLNLRNTKRIHKIVSQHYSGNKITAEGPEGEKVKWLPTDSFEQIAPKINECIKELCAREKIHPGQIAVLVATESELEELTEEGQLGGVPYSRCDIPNQNLLIVETIRRFKGLERSIVVLGATKNCVISKELAYIALSRARTYLIVFGSEKIIKQLKRPPGHIR